MDPVIQSLIDNNQDHTLTWLLYQLCLKLNMEYGFLTNLLLYDITKFLSVDRNRYWVDMGILTWLFYYLWKGKMNLESDSKFSYKILFASASVAGIVLYLDLDMFLWSAVFVLIFCFLIADIVIFIARMFQFKLVKILFIAFIVYTFIK